MSDMNDRPTGRHFKSVGDNLPTSKSEAPNSQGREERRLSHATSGDGSGVRSSYRAVYGVGASPRADGGRRRPKRRGKGVFIGVSIVLVLAIALVGVGVAALFSAKDLKAQASEVVRNVSVVSDSIGSRDYESASSAAREVADLVGKMDESLSSPLWTAASLVPVYGEDISSARALVSSLRSVADEALVPITDALQANPPSDLVTPEKTIDAAAIGELLTVVGDAAPAMQECADTVSGLPAFHIAQLEEMMGDAREKIVEANGLVQKAADLAPLARSIFGADGDRTYLIAAQNTAEMRASGGFPGSLGALSIHDGKIELGEFSKVYDVMAEETSPELGVTDAEIALFGGFMNVARDAGMDPDFTRVAEIWATAYEEKTGTHVDGVISVTPSVVQDLLAICGSITLSDGTVVDGDNATKVLQHDLYWKYLSKETMETGNGDVADALFAEAADLAFEQFFSGLDSESLMKFVELMGEGMDDRSVMFWLSDPSEQEVLSALGCSGDVITDPSEPAVGTYFSLWIGSKMGWYIDIDNEVISSRENADGSRTYKVKTVFRNTATTEIVDAAGDYIAGYLEGFDRDNLYPELLIYAPTGGSITSFEASGGVQFVEAEHKGLQVFHASRPDLRAGESIVCTYEVTTAPGEQEELAFMSTPTLTEYR